VLVLLRYEDVLDAPQRALAAALVPPTKGVAEAFGADVVHLPTRQGLTTTIPTLYHPWDLQHVPHPEFFEDGERRDREAIYRALCRQARVVVAPTRWAAEDLIANLQVPRREGGRPSRARGAGAGGRGRGAAPLHRPPSRRDLAARGRERSREFSWERTAPICRAHYRQVAGVRLAEDDHTLVQEVRT
jgi:hypothetical protein